MAAALQGLLNKPDVDISVQGGWTIVNEGAEHTLWSFTPADHPAHPAVVKRTIFERDGALYINMKACVKPRNRPVTG